MGCLPSGPPWIPWLRPFRWRKEREHSSEKKARVRNFYYAHRYYALILNECGKERVDEKADEPLESEPLEARREHE